MTTKREKRISFVEIVRFYRLKYTRIRIGVSSSGSVVNIFLFLCLFIMVPRVISE